MPPTKVLAAQRRYHPGILILATRMLTIGQVTPVISLPVLQELRFGEFAVALTDAGIEEIYQLVAQAALNSGQKNVPVHIFPLRWMTKYAPRRKHGGI